LYACAVVGEMYHVLRFFGDEGDAAGAIVLDFVFDKAHFVCYVYVKGEKGIEYQGIANGECESNERFDNSDDDN
jgi:hypothetical protein